MVRFKMHYFLRVYNDDSGNYLRQLGKKKKSQKILFLTKKCECRMQLRQWSVCLVCMSSVFLCLNIIYVIFRQNPISHAAYRIALSVWIKLDFALFTRLSIMFFNVFLYSVFNKFFCECVTAFAFMILSLS